MTVIIILALLYASFWMARKARHKWKNMNWPVVDE